MKITPDLFEAFLKYPTKRWLRATGEPPSGNAYAEWARSQNESYRATATERLLSETPKEESVLSPLVESLKTAQWRLATGVVAQAQIDSCVIEPRFMPWSASPPKPKLPSVRGRIIHAPHKRKCERHRDHPTMLVPTKKPAERSLIDLAFTKTGCKKTVLRYVGKRGRCPHCGQTYVPPSFKQVHHHVYGPGFSIWVVYLRMALRLSYRLIVQATRDLFGVDLSIGIAERFVKQCADNHVETEKQLV